jgi:hypothetical protein
LAVVIGDDFLAICEAQINVGMLNHEQLPLASGFRNRRFIVGRDLTNNRQSHTCYGSGQGTGAEFTTVEEWVFSRGLV